jgi:long-chain acyl-CoA synthetase
MSGSVATVASRVRERAGTSPTGIAMREKRLGIWQEITWADYAEHVELVAHALAAVGVAPGDRVAIHSENRPEWLYCDLGAVAARAISLGIYPTNPAAEVRYLLGDSGAKVLIAEDQEQVDKALDVKADLPDLEWIVYIEPRGVTAYDDPVLMSWEAFLERGREHRAAQPGLLDTLAAQVHGDDPVTLVYTSGTTGPPKGAVLTAANINYAIDVLVDGGGLYPGASPADLSVSYLPLAHVADRAGSEWMNAQAGVQLHFGEPGSELGDALREVQPSVFLAVPRVWEKLRATAEVRMASASRLKRATYRFWMRQAAVIGRAVAANGGAHTRATRLRYALGYPFLYRALRARMGLRRCRFAVSGAAPIAPEVLEWFFGLGVVVHEIYGMTENGAVATINRPGRLKLGTVGEAQPGIELRIDGQTGEILTRHPAVFAGYWRKPEASAEAVDPDGWLHTGDVGEMVDGTHLRIVDRLKDIVITAGGKNVSPSEIENALKFSPYIKEAVVIGDRRPYLVALIGIELDTVGDWAQRNGLPYTTYRDLSEKPEVLRLVQGIIAAGNESLAPPEQIKKFRMIVKELDHEDGELTATQKVKRSALGAMLGHLVDDMYGNRTEHSGGDMSVVHSVGSPPPAVGAPA